MRVAHYLTRGTTGRFYVRLRVPADLQACIGRKVIKRSTGTMCDRAALACALLLQSRYAQAFAAIRNGSMGSELDELLKGLEGTSPLELILKDVKLPGGASFGQVQINDHNDLSLFQKLAAEHSMPASVPFPLRKTVKPIGEARPAGLTLADARDKYLVSIQGKNTAKTIVQKTRALKDLEVFVASQAQGQAPGVAEGADAARLLGVVPARDRAAAGHHLHHQPVLSLRRLHQVGSDGGPLPAGRQPGLRARLRAQAAQEAAGEEPWFSGVHS
jgi:hypothetical protein